MQPVLDAVRAANAVGDFLPQTRLDDALEACWDLSFDEVARLYALPEPLCRAWATAAAKLEVTEPLDPYSDVNVLWTLPLRFFLVTTGYQRLQESKIGALGFRTRFEAVYVDALDESPRLGKEGLFRQVLTEHRLAATDVAVLGDSAESELAAGQRIGLWTIQILREGVPAAPNAHWRIRDLSELPAVLAQIWPVAATT